MFSFFPLYVKTRKKLRFLDYAYLLKCLFFQRWSIAKFNHTITLIVDDWSFGYFHWLLDAIPKLLIAIDGCSNVTIVLPEKMNEGFFLDSLKPFKNIRIIYLKERTTYFFTRAVVPEINLTTGNYHPELLLRLRAIYQQFFACLGQKTHNRIYISRANAAKRVIVNEREILPILNKYGFKICLFENLTFHEQVLLTSNSNILISCHGAGLSNILFMNSGTCIMEIRHKFNNHDNCYFTLSAAMNVRYYYFLADAYPEKATVDVHNSNLYVKPQRFEVELKKLISNA